MLSKRQRQVARAVYDGQLNEAEILQRFQLSPRIYNRWLEAEEFQRELDRYCAESNRRARCILSRFGPLAALRLAELIGSDKPDVARRAALDLIEHCLHLSADSKVPDDQTTPQNDLSDDKARRVLLTLAEGFRDQTNEEDK